MIWIILALVLGLLAFLYWKFFKLYKVKNIVFIDGSLGTGKSFYSVALAVRLYKRELRRWKVRNVLCKLLHRELPERPALYSNIRLRNIEFTKITKDMLFRQNYRFPYKSILLLDEFSLVADQFCYKDREMSERLSNFFKLFRHETKGGYCVINSQTTSDLHYSVKYVLSDYLYIHHNTRLPFVRALKVQEMAYCADKDGQSVTNVRNEDIEETCKTILVFSKYFKYYDSYCYSIFTDGLPIYEIGEFNEKKAYIKDANLVSFKEYKYLTENLEKERRSVK